MPQVNCTGETILVRQMLNDDAHFYVRPDGNDDNDGSADDSEHAFLTIQRALNVVRNTLDFAGHAVKIHVADGTYTQGVSISGAQIGNGSLWLLGNTANPGNCVIAPASGHAIAGYDGARLIVRGFKLVASAPNTSGVLCYTGSHMNVGAVEYGACAYMHNDVGSEAVLELYGPYAISGGAVGHWHVGSPGQIVIGSVSAVITNDPVFSAYFAGIAGGFIMCRSFTWSGSATGQRYLVHKNGLLDSNPSISPAIPGSIPGAVATGGVFVP